jgi:secretion/DNA translocation related TadE-like protein
MPGAVVALGALGCVASLTMGLSIVGGAAVAGQRTAGAADAAALAAADAASGAATGEPCDRAGQIAAATGARIAECEVRGLIATVTVEATYAGMTVRASARAGPPPSL